MVSLEFFSGPSIRTMAPESTQPLKEISICAFPQVKAAAAKADNLTITLCCFHEIWEP
jgi:hypothetical protein